MIIIQRSLLWVAIALQASCFSAQPRAPQPYPIPDPSVFASSNCEELAYQRDGYQQLLQNVAVDHPNDSHLYVPMYQANHQGLSNALALRNCPVTGKTSVASSTPASSESYCFAQYTYKNLLRPSSPSTGVVSKLWQAGSISGAPARDGLIEFQSFLISRVNSEQLGPPSCGTLEQLQSCSASQADSGSFSHGVRLAMVLCATSMEGIEKGWASMRASNPQLQVVDWRPAQTSAITASSTPVTQSSVVAPSTKAVPVTTAVLSPAHGDVPPALKSTAAPKASGQLGVYTSSVTPTAMKSFGLPNTNGVLVFGPMPGGNAERDGMLPGDIILAIDGKPVKTPAELTAISSRMHPGSQVLLRVWRYRAAIDVSVEMSTEGGR